MKFIVYYEWHCQHAIEYFKKFTSGSNWPCLSCFQTFFFLLDVRGEKWEIANSHKIKTFDH